MLCQIYWIVLQKHFPTTRKHVFHSILQIGFARERVNAPFQFFNYNREHVSKMHVFSFDPCTLNLVLRRCIKWMCHLGQIWMGKDNRLTLFLAFFFAPSWQGSIPYSSRELDFSLSFSARVFTKKTSSSPLTCNPSLTWPQ